jgi:hypothetical protein
MYLGIDQHTGLVYEGYGAPEIPSIPTPHIAQAKLIERDDDWAGLPRGFAGTPMAWLFREDSFDPVTRTRRGRLYEAQPGQGQPNQQRVGPHPYEDPMMRAVGREGRVAKTMYTYTACNPLLNMPNQGQGLTLALGSDRASSAWRIIQTEVSASGCVLVTLKALSAFAILPEIDYGQIAGVHQAAVRGAVQRVLDSAFRESPTSVVDHCRAALTVLLSRWLVQNGHDERTLGLDLGDLAKKFEGPPHEMGCPSRVAQVVARLHSRGKPNEQHAKGYRPPIEGDDEFALQAVSLVLRDFGWAK